MRSRNRRTSPGARRVPPDHQPFASARFGRKYTMGIIRTPDAHPDQWRLSTVALLNDYEKRELLRLIEADQPLPAHWRRKHFNPGKERET